MTWTEPAAKGFPSLLHPNDTRWIWGAPSRNGAVAPSGCRLSAGFSTVSLCPWEPCSCWATQEPADSMWGCPGLQHPQPAGRNTTAGLGVTAMYAFTRKGRSREDLVVTLVIFQHTHTHITLLPIRGIWWKVWAHLMASVGFLLHRELAHLQFYGQKSLLKAHSSAQQHKWEHQWVHSIHTQCSPRDWAMSQFWGWKAKIKCQHRLRWKQQVMVRGVSRIRSISVWAVCWFHLFRLLFFWSTSEVQMSYGNLTGG